MREFRVLQWVLGVVWVVLSVGCERPAGFLNPLPYLPNQSIDSRLVGYWKFDGSTPISVFQQKDHLEIRHFADLESLTTCKAYTFSSGKRKFLNGQCALLHLESQGTYLIPANFVVEYEVNRNTVRVSPLNEIDFPPNTWVKNKEILLNSTEGLVKLLKTLPPLETRANFTLNRLTPEEYESQNRSVLLFDERNEISRVWGIHIESFGDKAPMHRETSKLSVQSVSRDSIAAKAGMRAGDQIIQLDDQMFRSERDIILALFGKGSDASFSLTIERSGERKTIQLERSDDARQRELKKDDAGN